VVHHKGKRLVSFRKAWATTCDEAKLGHVLVHDLRRSAVRNLVRQDTRESVAMRIGGQLTRSVFEDYNVTSDDDLKAALGKQDAYLDQQGAKAPEPVVVPIAGNQRSA
jgi:integrase